MNVNRKPMLLARLSLAARQTVVRIARREASLSVCDPIVTFGGGSLVSNG